MFEIVVSWESEEHTSFLKVFDLLVFHVTSNYDAEVMLLTHGFEYEASI